MSRRFPWSRLGIDETADKAAIRKAYADALRALNVDEDIAGYADLRQARDSALWLAAQAARPQDDDFGLGGFDDDADGEADSGFAFEPADFSVRVEAHDVADAHPSAVLDDPPPPEIAESQRAAQDAWQKLLDILYPGGEPSEDSVTYAEMDEGLALLDVLLTHLETADLAEHEALDAALADVFASTWPRSAPFVEPANAALHWLDEAGQLEERGALMFLNARIKGMRFHEKVQRPDHPLNKAWVELSRPGRASVLDRLRVKRLEVDKLLTGIRERYPELESFLDPQRVSSWEGSTNSAGVSDTGPKVVRGIFIAFAVIMVIRFVVNFSDPRPDAPAAPPIVVGPSTEAIDTAVTDIFGEGLGMKGVRAADPVFADQLRNTANNLVFSERPLIIFVRLKALEAGEIADFDALVMRAELRRLWLDAAQRQSGDVCRNVLTGDFVSVPLELSDKERAREQALLRGLLAAQVLHHQAKGGETRFSIPGWLIEDALARSGLGIEALRRALGDPADDNRCRVEIALFGAILAKPGRVPVELLRGL